MRTRPSGFLRDHFPFQLKTLELGTRHPQSPTRGEVQGGGGLTLNKGSHGLNLILFTKTPTQLKCISELCGDYFIIFYYFHTIQKRNNKVFFFRNN